MQENFTSEPISFGRLFAMANAMLKGNYFKSLLVLLICYGIMQGINHFSFGLGAIFLTPLLAGKAFFFLQLRRNFQPDIDVIFQPFSNYWHFVAVNLLSTFFILLPFLLVIPLGAAAVVLGIAGSYIAAGILALAAVLTIIPSTVISLSLFAVNYVLLDAPATPIMDVIKTSRQLMHGHKLQLFAYNILLTLISIPVIFLTCGLGLLWYLPFCENFSAAYYNEIAKNKNWI